MVALRPEGARYEPRILTEHSLGRRTPESSFQEVKPILHSLGVLNLYFVCLGLYGPGHTRFAGRPGPLTQDRTARPRPLTEHCPSADPRGVRRLATGGTLGGMNAIQVLAMPGSPRPRRTVGQDADTVRRIRDDIRRLVDTLVAEIIPGPARSLRSS